MNYKFKSLNKQTIEKETYLMNKNILFQPLTLKNGFTFKNRFVKPAMSEIKCNFSEEDIYNAANTRLGWYKRSTGNVINFLLSLKVLGISKADLPGLVDPLEYYLARK